MTAAKAAQPRGDLLRWRDRDRRRAHPPGRRAGRPRRHPVRRSGRHQRRLRRDQGLVPEPRRRRRPRTRTARWPARAPSTARTRSTPTTRPSTASTRPATPARATPARRSSSTRSSAPAATNPADMAALREAVRVAGTDTTDTYNTIVGRSRSTRTATRARRSSRSTRSTPPAPAARATGSSRPRSTQPPSSPSTTGEAGDPTDPRPLCITASRPRCPHPEVRDRDGHRLAQSRAPNPLRPRPADRSALAVGAVVLYLIVLWIAALLPRRADRREGPPGGPPADRQRPVDRRDLRADRPRLHDGLRDHRAHQLRPRRHLHARGVPVRRLPRRDHRPDGRA